MSDKYLVMYANDSYTLTAEVTPENAVDKSIVWSSSDAEVASVSEGVITAIGYGKANVIAYVTTNNAVADTCSVLVYEHTTGIEMSANTIEMYIGETTLLTAATLPLAKSDGQIEWNVSDESIIERDADGNITALAEGIVEITATSVDGGHIAKCTIIVKGANSIDDLLYDNNASFRIYNQQGLLLKHLQQGINIVIFEDGTTRKIIVK